MMFGKSKENGIWLAATPRWTIMFFGHDSFYFAAHRLRFRIMKPTKHKAESGDA